MNVSLIEGNPGSWSTSISSYAYVDGGQYTLQSKGYRPAGIETAPKTVNFTIDRTNPTAAIVVPVNNGNYQTLSSITGTSADTVPGVVNDVQLQIKKTIGANDYFFNGSSWQMNVST